MLHPRFNDSRLAMVIGLGSLALLAITPIMVTRFIQQQPVRGFIDLTLLLCIGGNMAYVWRTGNSLRAGVFGAISCSAGAAAIAYLDVRAGTAWIYPVIIANFMLVSHVRAVALAALLIAGTVLTNGGFQGNFERVTFAVTASITALFGLAFAWQMFRQHAALERLSLEDPLTGVGNRRALDNHIGSQLDSLGRGYGIAVVDIDRFKGINDANGHLEGDGVLRELANLLRRHLRSGDDVFRYGGEEFLLLLPGVCAETMQGRMESLRSEVEATLRICGTPVTVSIGAAVTRAGEVMSECFARADAAMYEAKRAGRNQVVMASP